MCSFLAELNNLDSYTTDIGNAYIQSYTREKIVVRAGNEFGDQADHLLIVNKSLYGLTSSGIKWNKTLGRCLSNLGFKRSKCESDISYCDKGDHYEYIGTYVDDLIVISRDCQAILKALQSEPYNFKLKGTSTINGAVHLGSFFFLRDKDGTLTMNPNHYLKRMEESYKLRFPGEEIDRKVKSPLDPDDHPELDTSEFLKGDDIIIYQSLIGAFQWAVSIGR